MLKWLFGSRRPVDAKPVKKTQGFFSTNVFPQGDRLAVINAVQKMSFPIQLSDMKQYNVTGEVVEGTGMDTLQQTKYLNSVQFNGISSYMPDAQLYWYGAQGFIGYQTCALIAQNWLVDKACRMPAQDAARHGYEITVNDGTTIDPSIIEELKKLDKKFGIKKQCVELVRMGRVFGIRIAMFIVSSTDPMYYEKPFNPDGVTKGSYKGISQIDPYWVSPELDNEAAANPASKHFQEPTWWRINGKRVHRTHLVIMRNSEVADILKPAYLYGGISIPQKISERVYAAERTANEAPMLAMSKRMTVMKLDLTQAMANQSTFNERMRAWSEYMNNFGVKIVGEGDTIEQFDTALADVDTVMMSQYQLVSAASDVPATKLIGTTPKGFNATGEYDEKSYHEMLETIQEHDMTPLVDRHHLLCIRSIIAPKFGIQPFGVEISWNSTSSPTAKENAEVNYIKSQTALNYSSMGAINGQDARDNIIADKDSGYNGLSSEAPEPEIQESDLLNDGSGMDGVSLIDANFNFARGTINGANLVTAQRFLDETKVLEKIRDEDFKVFVSREFERDGNKYRSMIDGHHSLAAAVRMNREPLFIEASEDIFNVVTQKIDP